MATSLQTKTDRNVIRGVVVLARESSNRRVYADAALRDSARILNSGRGRMVFMGPHVAPQAVFSMRDLTECVAIIRNARVQGEMVLADLHVRSAHPRSAELLEAARNDPSKFACSQLAFGDTKALPDGRTLITSINEIVSVDLIADGSAGTAKSLFESRYHTPRSSTMTATLTRNNRRVQLLERTMQSGRSNVNRETGVISNVKVISPESKNGYGYGNDALDQIAKLCEGVSVHIDHDKANPSDPPLSTKFGILKNVRRTSDGVRADLIANTSHPMYEQICEAAEKFPESFGLSLNSVGNVGNDGSGKRMVNSIERVNSCDLVSRPATNKSLFESDDDEIEESDDEKDELEESDDGDLEATVESILSSSLSAGAKSKAIAALFAGREVPDGESGADPSDPLQLELNDPSGGARGVAGEGSSIKMGQSSDSQGNVAQPKSGDRSIDWSLIGKNSGGPAAGSSRRIDQRLTGNARRPEGMQTDASGGTRRGPNNFEESFIEALNGRGVVRLGPESVPLPTRKPSQRSRLRALLERANQSPAASIPTDPDEFCRSLTHGGCGRR